MQAQKKKASGDLTSPLSLSIAKATLSFALSPFSFFLDRQPFQRKMEPEQSASEQTSPRGNDWEVVQLTSSAYAAAPGPKRSEPSEESEGKEYDIKGKDSSAALLMSGHFSVSQNEVESLLKGTDCKEQQKELHGQDEVSDEGTGEEFGEKYEDTCKHKLKDDLHGIPSFDKGKSLSLVDMEFEDGKALQGMSLVGAEPVVFSSSGYGTLDVEKDSSRNDDRTGEPPSQTASPGTDSSKVPASSEQNKPDGSGLPRDAWWRQQLVSLYKNAKETNKFWPVFVAAAALMGIAYFGRRWQRGKLQLQQVKLQPSSNKERVNHVVRPLSRVKGILVAGNHPSPVVHGHARFS